MTSYDGFQAELEKLGAKEVERKLDIGAFSKREAVWARSYLERERRAAAGQREATSERRDERAEAIADEANAIAKRSNWISAIAALVALAAVFLSPALEAPIRDFFRERLAIGQPKPDLRFAVIKQTKAGRLHVSVRNDGDRQAIVYEFEACPPNDGWFRNRTNDRLIELGVPEKPEDIFPDELNTSTPHWYAGCKRVGQFVTLDLVSQTRSVPPNGALDLEFEAPPNFYLFSGIGRGALPYSVLCSTRLATDSGSLVAAVPCSYDESWAK